MSKVISELLKNWATVVIFVIGLALIGVGAYSFNSILGYIVSGLELCLVSYILDKEGGE